jgi:hypothetical protein
MPDTPPNSVPATAPELAPEDFYYESPYGACCHSGCRHCPFADPLNSETSEP